MKKRVFALCLLLLTLTLSACGSSKSNNAAKALAEAACVLFDSSEDPSTLSERSTDIYNNYGFENDAEVKSYIAELDGTPEYNEIVATTRDHLETTCSDVLEAEGISAAELSEALVQE